MMAVPEREKYIYTIFHFIFLLLSYPVHHPVTPQIYLVTLLKGRDHSTTFQINRSYRSSRDVDTTLTRVRHLKGQ